MEPEICHQHFAYNAWATKRLLQASSGLTEEQMMHDFGTADKSVAGTMLHLFRSERIWLHRIQNQAAVFSPSEDNWETVKSAWPELQRRWIEWSAQLSADDLRRTFEYHDLKGSPRSNVLWEIVMQVINHGTHHRGQVSGFLRALGTAPPSLDYVVFVRELQVSRAALS